MALSPCSFALDYIRGSFQVPSTLKIQLLVAKSSSLLIGYRCHYISYYIISWSIEGVLESQPNGRSEKQGQAPFLQSDMA